MIIGLNGRLKSGKDTTFKVIKEFVPEAERISFADKLKDSAAAVLGIDRDTLEELKNREDFLYTLRGFQDDVPVDLLSRVPNFNVRVFLQRYGTEGHRDIFDDNFWVNMALPLDLDHEGKLFVVTDMRFPNEAQRVKDLGGYTIKVVRDTITGHANHPSEQNIDSMIDYFIDNTGSLDDLRVRTKHMIEPLISGEIRYDLETNAYTS